MGYQIGDFVNVKDNPLLHILVAFNGDQVTVRPAGPDDTRQRVVSFDSLVKQTQRASNLTPFQRGLLHSIKMHDTPAWLYRHFNAPAKRSINCLILKGYVELFDDTEVAPNGEAVSGQGVRVTWAGRRVDTSF